MAQISKILGIDHGKSKVGIAIADKETKMAFGLITIENDKNFFNALKKIITENEVNEIVVGITVHQKDEKSAQAKIEFAKQIEHETGIKVALHEEMFTTKMAHENLKLHGQKGIAAHDDKEAARIILQSWLDKNKTFENSSQVLKNSHCS